MKKIVLAVVLIVSVLSMTIPAIAQENEAVEPVLISANLIEYDDLEGCWCKESVEKYGYPEIFEGDDGNFYPNKSITRMEFARMLHKAMGININYFAATDIAEYFEDVSNEDIGAGNLYDLVTIGVIDKTGSFRPDEKLCRDEMIHYIINALDYMTGGDYAMIMIMPAPFDDDASIDAEYKSDVYKAVVLNLIYGRGNNMLFPDDGASRAEAVTVVDRLMTLAPSLMPSVYIGASARESSGDLVISLTIQNNTDETVVINHTSGQKYDFALFDSTGESLYRWSIDKLFIAALTTTEIGPGEKIEFSDSIESAIYSPVKDKVTSIKAYITGTSDDIEINPDGYEAKTKIS